jgi:hypothetical protein
VKFLLRQIAEYIQITEFMIRKTPALGQGELALARKLRTKLTPGKQTEQEQTEREQDRTEEAMKNSRNSLPKK